MKHTLQLAKKYSRPGPRYTSYPTAPQFREDIDPKALLEADAQSTDPLSLYVHIPFCETLCRYCGCNTVTTKNHGAATPYLDRMERELDLLAPYYQQQRPVVQMHFGGGTPNFLTTSEIERVNKLLRTHFNFADDCESSVELDPRRLSEEQVITFRNAGFNRASFGIQDTNPDVQQLIRRIQPQAINEQAMQWLRENGFQSANVDLIYGLPRQTPDTFRQTLAHTLALKPSRLAVFGYAHVPWMKKAQKTLEADLPDPDTRLALHQLATDTLTQAGYVDIGLDHFAKPDDELAIAQRNGTLQRNFQGYSTRGGAHVLGIGLSSISQGTHAYRQNFKQLSAYNDTLDSHKLPIDRGLILTEDDRIRRHTIMRLMCDRKLHYPTLSATLAIDFSDYFKTELASFDEEQQDGLLTLSKDQLTVTEHGQPYIRNLAMHFDKYLTNQSNQYSKTV